MKKGILLQLFGGTRKDFSSTGRGKFRYAKRIHGIMFYFDFVILNYCKVPLIKPLAALTNTGLYSKVV